MSEYKNRTLSIIDYFDKLQLEYIVTELRKKIYFKKKDKLYYSRVLEQKKSYIEDISLRNKIPSIFNDVNVKKLYYDKIYNEFGLPNFFYKDKNHELEYKLKDLTNYFLQGSEVKFKDGQKLCLGTIIMLDVESNSLLIESKLDKKLSKQDINSVSRIL